MTKYRFLKMALVLHLLQALFCANVTGQPSLSLGRMEGGLLYYEELTRSRKTVTVPVSEEVVTMCRSGDCTVAWSEGVTKTWIAIRNTRTQDLVVIDNKGQFSWKARIPFEVRSMLSVSKTGQSIAAVGRLNGEEHIWHLDAESAQAVWKVALARYSGRLQVGWFDSSTRNVFSDGEWIDLCDLDSTPRCRHLTEGEFPAVSPDGTMIAVFENAKTVSVYNVRRGEVMSRLTTESEWASESPKWCPDSKCLAINEATAKGSRIVLVKLNGKRSRYSRSTNGRNTSEIGLVRSPGKEGK